MSLWHLRIGTRCREEAAGAPVGGGDNRHRRHPDVPGRPVREFGPHKPAVDYVRIDPAHALPQVYRCIPHMHTTVVLPDCVRAAANGHMPIRRSRVKVMGPCPRT
ncbi:hypothetical protein GCM10022284_53070 [Streptomyces hundungensis]